MPIDFNDALDFSTVSNDRAIGATRISSVSLTLGGNTSSEFTGEHPVTPFDNIIELVEDIELYTNQDSETALTASEPSTPTTTPQPPAYANDYPANLVSQPVPSTSEVTNDINSYVDDIEFDDPGYINTTFHEVGYIGSDVDGSTFGNFSDFDGYSDFGADNDAGISTSGGGDAFGGDFGDGPGDSFMPVVLDLNGDGARYSKEVFGSRFDFGEGGFVRRLAGLTPTTHFWFTTPMETGL